jgi:hypothetical protein
MCTHRHNRLNDILNALACIAVFGFIGYLLSFSIW